MLTDTTIASFRQLLRAVRANQLVLLDCTDALTGAPVAALCAIEGHPGTLHVVPFAAMLVGDPLRQLVPPADNGDDTDNPP